MRRRTDHGIQAPVPALVLILLCTAAPAAADIISLTGNLILGVNTGNVAQMTGNGLGIGTTVPSANLHVAGNAVVGNALVAGGASNASGSTLHISGALGQSAQAVTGTTTLSANSLVLADSSSGNFALTLPAPAGVPGRVYTIKKTSTQNTVTVYGDIDDRNLIRMTSSGCVAPSLSVISGGNQWYILSATDGLAGGSIVATGNLLSWWRLDETSGTTAQDAGSAANHGTLSGVNFATDGASGALDRSLNLAGLSTEYASLASNPAVRSGAFSVSAWVYPDAALTTGSIEGRGVVRSTTGNKTNDWMLSVTPTCALRFFHWRSDGVTSDAHTTSLGRPVRVNTWHHLCAVYDGASTYTLYVDGVSLTHAAGTTYSGWGTGHEIGRSYAGDAWAWSGNIDDVRLYTTALSAAQVAALADEATNPSTTTISSNLVLEFKMEETSGTTITDSAWYNTSATLNGMAAGNVGVAGHISRAHDFDGSNDSISTSGFPTSLLGTGSFTASAWIYARSLAAANATYGAGILIYNTGDQTGNFQISVKPTGALCFYNWRNTGADTDGKHVTAAGVITTGTWYHVAVVWDGSTNTIYVNGVSQGFSDETTGTTWATTFNVGYSYAGAGYYWSGLIDQVKIFNKALSAAEVAALAAE